MPCPSNLVVLDILQRNVYNQKVYGTEEALVSVGYEYDDCSSPANSSGGGSGGGGGGGGGAIWETVMVVLAGFQPAISDIGGWAVNIHHRLAQGE